VASSWFILQSNYLFKQWMCSLKEENKCPYMTEWLHILAEKLTTQSHENYQLHCGKNTGWTFRDSSRSRGKTFCSSPKGPYRLWGPPSHLFNGYRVSFPRV